MKYLVTGCAGFIGSHLSESLLTDGHDVVGIDCFNENYDRWLKLANLGSLQAWKQFTFIPLDLSRGEFGSIVAEVDGIFHLAAEPGVRASWDHTFERYVRNNVLGTKHILDAAREVAGVKVVYASSSSVYGDNVHGATPETTLTRPHSPYGVTKLAAENLCMAYSANLGLPVISLRYFSVFGPRQRPDMAFHRFCRAALNGDSITVFGDGLQRRDFTYVGDIVAATRSAMVSPIRRGLYNVGGGAPTVLADAIRILAEVAGVEIKVNYLPAELGDVRETAADCSAAATDLAFAPATDLRTGLDAEFSWIRSVFG